MPSFRYTKRPVTIEAFRFDGQTNLRADKVPMWFVDAILDGCIIAFPSHIHIKTLEGDMRADVGDWIIRGVKGEIYPCKPSIFAETYDAEVEQEPRNS